MKTDKQIAPYGSWKSPITAEEVYSKFIGLGAIQVEGSSLYWSEFRSDGRNVIVSRPAGGVITDNTPPGYNVRTRVHEYGGGDFLVADGVVYFSNFDDQHLYRQAPGTAPEMISKVDGMRYADYRMDRSRNRLVGVREDHTTGAAQPVNSLAGIALDDGSPDQILVAGSDFYSTPRLSPDGGRLAWLTWNHPNMPWDGTELWLGTLLPDGAMGEKTLVAGGISESIFQPEWSPDGTLYFVSDRTGFWNLYRWRDGAVEALLPMQAEFGEPQWGFRTNTYGFESADRLIYTYCLNGRYSMGSLDTHSLEFKKFDLPYTCFFDIYPQDEQVYFIGMSSTDPVSLLRMSLITGEEEVIRRSRDVNIPADFFSLAQAVEFPTEGGLSAHAFYYPPANPDFAGPGGELPPLLVMSHGGPTAATIDAFRYSIQYWTTRGVAVLDVNYGGSTGYGRAYRERLKGQWGIVDVADCVNGARYLVRRGLADGDRLAITGGSAGGYCTLCALTFHDTFKAGASYYGIGDLEALAKDTHKFESRYMDGLIGPYPQARDVYIARSPIHHVNQITCPMIILQGLDDPVVPPKQAQSMVDALLARKLPVAYLTFAGEQHGFVKAENNIRALEAELYFYSKVFKFELADAVEPVRIENL
jgi:dipeptidyl aminopeptidase/acylaminoacyl peptidase